MELTHVNESGEARMVDVGGKEHTRREAVARGFVRMAPATLALIASGEMPKGDVFACARIAGIMAAKRTPELIPMCHPIPVDGVDMEITAQAHDTVCIEAKVRCTYKTGVEMEALTAVSVAALTVYDMCKAVDKDMVIDGVGLMQKTGGKSDYRAGK